MLPCLSPKEVSLSREKYGSNELDFKKENKFIDALKSLLKEPMVVLLLKWMNRKESVFTIKNKTDKVHSPN